MTSSRKNQAISNKDRILQKRTPPMIAAFNMIAVEQYPGSVILQCFADKEKNKLLGVAYLDTQSRIELMTALNIENRESQIVMP